MQGDVVTYSTVISACARRRPADLRSGRRAFESMINSGLVPDEYSLPAILRCCAYARPRDSAFAEKVFRAHGLGVNLKKHVKGALK